MYTDFFGQTINVGDEVVWPAGTYSNPHALRRGPILEIVPLVPHRDGSSSWGPRNPYMRADQAHKADATRYPEPKSPDKAFVAKVENKNHHGQSKALSIRNPLNIIKVPDGC